MALEQVVQQNTSDIKQLTINITRLATMMENSEKRHDGDMDDVKELTVGINKLTERINAVVNMEKDISAIRDALSDKTGDIRTLRHDLNNMANAMGGITLLNEKLNELSKTVAEQGVEISALKTWRNKMEGAGSAIKGMGAALWALMGAGVCALLAYLIKLFFVPR